VFSKLLIDGLNDHEEKCQIKTSEILNILFPIVAQQLNQKACNEILSMILYYVLCICLAFLYLTFKSIAFFILLITSSVEPCVLENVYVIY